MPEKTMNTTSNAQIGFEQELWKAADKMRGHMDSSEYKHVALGLIFLKYISDSFEEKHNELKKDKAANPNDPDEYLAENVFWVPEKARWSHIEKNAHSESIGKQINNAMRLIEESNEHLKDVLPKEYDRSNLRRQQLTALIGLIGNIQMKDNGEKDVLGRVYEYFLSRFAKNEGKNSGEFYTPHSIVKLLVEMLEPFEGRVYDPCCGSGGMFVQSERFIKEHGGDTEDISIYGQESNFTTWRLCKMNLAIRHIEANIGSGSEDTFHLNLHNDLKADYVLANPPFNMADWGGSNLIKDTRWKYGTPPESNANFAWIQHIVHHLAKNGIAGVVLANGALTTVTNNEGEIRKRLVDENVVDCIVSLPGQLFYSTAIPVSLWFLAKDRKTGKAGKTKLRNRHNEILFIDASEMGYMIDRVHRDLDYEKDIAYITDAYHSWRGEKVKHKKFSKGYQDVLGFCRGASIEEIKEHDYQLTPGRYVGIEETQKDETPFAEKMEKLTQELSEQMKESIALDKEIRRQLKGIGYEI